MRFRKLTWALTDNDMRDESEFASDLAEVDSWL